MFKRKCLQCNSDILHNSKKNLKKAEIKGQGCSECACFNNKINNLLNKGFCNNQTFSEDQIKQLFESKTDKEKREILLKEFLENNIKNSLNKRNCPNCNIEITYNVRRDLNIANINESLCKECSHTKSRKYFYISYTRTCPQCSSHIEYNNYSSFNGATRKNSTCKKCHLINFNIINKTYTRENNPFYGKKHTNETRDKLKESWQNPSESKQKYIDYRKSDEYKIKFKEEHSGENNPRYGLGSLKDIWIRKLGEEEGIKRWIEWKELQKERSPKGENNHMFGRPSPNGSGNGWSGWYKDWFFRSIGELSYMINVIERFNLEWKNGETQEFKVKYTDWEGKEKNYFPDFIISNKYMVEVKPKKLWGSPKVKLKEEGAKIFCKDNGLVYKLVDARKLSTEEMIYLYETKMIKFTDKYEEKFKERFKIPKF